MEPPNLAISFTTLLLKKLYSFDVARKTVSISVDRVLLVCAIWSSTSKSEIARKPLNKT